jgi:hypothetical protein
MDPPPTSGRQPGLRRAGHLPRSAVMSFTQRKGGLQIPDREPGGTYHRRTYEMRQLTLIATLVLGSVLFPSSAAWACSCAQSSPVQQAARADAVFLGKVTSIERTRAHLVAAVAVETTYKGAASGSIEVRTANEESACGFPFLEGTDYTIFAERERSGGLSTNICTATQAGDIDPVAYGLGAPSGPAAPSESMDRPVPAWVWPAVFAGALGAGMALLLLLIRRRRV